jgi:hypothetical protein
MTSSRIRNWFVIIVITFFCVLCLVEWRINIATPLSTAQRTIGAIRYCEWLESGYLNSNQIVPFLRSNEAAGLSLNKVFKGMQSYPGCLPEDLIANKRVEFTTNLDEIKDGWGNPILFMWRSSAQTGLISEGLLRKQFPVLIWSCGKNGSNEYGHGDDVYSDQVK